MTTGTARSWASFPYWVEKKEKYANLFWSIFPYTRWSENITMFEFPRKKINTYQNQILYDNDQTDEKSCFRCVSEPLWSYLLFLPYFLSFICWIQEGWQNKCVSTRIQIRLDGYRTPCSPDLNFASFPRKAKKHINGVLRRNIMQSLE